MSFRINVPDEINEPTKNTKPTPQPASGFNSAGSGSQRTRITTSEIKSETHLISRKLGRKPEKQMIYGAQAQINIKTFKKQKEAFNALQEKTELSKADLFDLALALTIQYFNEGKDLRSIEKNFEI